MQTTGTLAPSGRGGCQEAGVRDARSWGGRYPEDLAFRDMQRRRSRHWARGGLDPRLMIAGLLLLVAIGVAIGLAI